MQLSCHARCRRVIVHQSIAVDGCMKLYTRRSVGTSGQFQENSFLQRCVFFMFFDNKIIDVFVVGSAIKDKDRQTSTAASVLFLCLCQILCLKQLAMLI
jgi:hypothetical protein